MNIGGALCNIVKGITIENYILSFLVDNSFSIIPISSSLYKALWSCKISSKSAVAVSLISVKKSSGFCFFCCFLLDIFKEIFLCICICLNFLCLRYFFLLEYGFSAFRTNWSVFSTNCPKP